MSGQLQTVQAAAVLANTDMKTVTARMQAIRSAMNTVMKADVHYGIVPGTKLPSLYKSGSEVLLTMFQIAVEPEVFTEKEGDHTTYTVHCKGIHQATGVVIGVGIGSCSTAEEKYAWRSAVCREEYDATPEHRRREKWFKGWGEKPPYSVLQVRTNPADLSNTVLKMAKKRAQMDLTLTGLGASDLFSQDLEDLPEEYLDQTNGEASKAPSKPGKYNAADRSQGKPTADGAATEAQVGYLKKLLDDNGKSAADLCDQYKIEAITAMPKAQVNSAIDWIKAKA